MSDAKLRKVVKLLSDMPPERIATALDVVSPVDAGMSPATLAILVRRIVRSWEMVLEAGRLP